MAWGGRTLVPPKPADEQVLLVWDRATQTQHFVRQVRFSDAGGRFGFIVPSPSKPTLHDVKAEPWERLNQRCAPSWDGRGTAFRGGLGIGLIGGLGHGSGRGLGSGGAAPAPTLLEERKLGDFTAFVLEASDAEGFSAWLKKNDFKSTPELTNWLAHYIKLGFYFTALRFDGETSAAAPKPANAELTSKTVHISFKAANPYYPYLEPLAPQGAKPLKERKLQVWFVSDQIMQPVARYTAPSAGSGGGGGTLVRPWSETYPCDGALADVSKALDGELEKIVAAQKYVQVFADLKTSREGYGDVLLHPLSAISCDADCQTSRARLVKVLQAENALSASPPAAAPPEPYLAPSGCGISAGPRSQQGAASGGPAPRDSTAPVWLLGGALLWGLRRSRSRGAVMRGDGSRIRLELRAVVQIAAAAAMLTLLPGCKAEPTSPSPPAMPASGALSAAPSAPSAARNSQPEPGLSLPADSTAERAALLDLLAGSRAAPSLPVHATDERRGLGGVDDLLPVGTPGVEEIQAACVATSGVEAVLRVRAEFKQNKLVEAELVGPISSPARQCIRAALMAVAPKPAADPSSGNYSSKFALGLGGATPEQLRLRRRFAYTPAAYARGGRPLRFSKATVEGALPPEVVQRVLRSRFGPFRKCLAAAPASLKAVKLTFTIDEKGAVKKSVRSLPAAGTHGGCLRAQVEKIRFPTPERGVVKVSFELKVGEQPRGPSL